MDSMDHPSQGTELRLAIWVHSPKVPSAFARSAGWPPAIWPHISTRHFCASRPRRKKKENCQKHRGFAFKPPLSFHDFSRWIKTKKILDFFRSIEKVGKHQKPRFWWIQKFPQWFSSSSVRSPLRSGHCPKRLPWSWEKKRFLWPLSQLPASQWFLNERSTEMAFCICGQGSN